jgi:hypothetical protein
VEPYGEHSLDDGQGHGTTSQARSRPRPLTRSDPPGRAFTPLADSTAPGFATPGAPQPDLARILRSIAESVTPR